MSATCLIGILFAKQLFIKRVNMLFPSLKYGHLVYKKIDKSTYRDFKFNDHAAITWGEEVYGNWAEQYPYLIKSIDRRGAFADYWRDHEPLSHYCGNTHYNANNYYRSNGSGDDYFDSLKAVIIDIIDAAPRIPDNIVVYRALVRIDFWDFKLLNGLRNPFVELGPMSTSLSASILTRKQDDLSSDFSACRYALKIFVPKGAKAVFVDVLAKHIANLDRGEIEILFPPESKLYMLSYPYKQWGKTVIDCCLAL